MGQTTAERALKLYETFEQAGKRPVEVVVEGRKLRVIMSEQKTIEDDRLNIKWSKQ